MQRTPPAAVRAPSVSTPPPRGEPVVTAVDDASAALHGDVVVESTICMPVVDTQDVSQRGHHVVALDAIPRSNSEPRHGTTDRSGVQRTGTLKFLDPGTQGERSGIQDVERPFLYATYTHTDRGRPESPTERECVEDCRCSRCCCVRHALAKVHDEWGVPEPELLVSVTGGAMNFQSSYMLREKFKSGLKAALEKTKGVVVTGGSDAGVMKLVGDGVSNSHDTSSVERVPCIAIVPAGAPYHGYRDIRNQYLRDITIDKTSPGGKARSPEAYASLNSEHTHFIIVEVRAVRTRVPLLALHTRSALR